MNMRLKIILAGSVAILLLVIVMGILYLTLIYMQEPERLFHRVTVGMSEQEVAEILKSYEVAPNWYQSFRGVEFAQLVEGADLPVDRTYNVKGWKVGRRKELWIWFDGKGRATSKFLLNTR